MKIAIINGPNLNLLGRREPDVYGKKSFEEYFEELKSENSELDLNYFQSNHESELIQRIQACNGEQISGIVINAASLSHTSIGILDALNAVGIPYIEVHISNIASREDYRKFSYLSRSASGVIYGFGLKGYSMALEAFKNS